MGKLKKRLGIAAGLIAGMLFASTAGATAITMDFDGLTSLASVDNYYAGGCTKLFTVPWNCGGPDYGVTWKNAIVAGDHASLLFTTDATMNVAGGFITGLSFNYYAIAPFGNSVSVYSGLDGQGTLLAQSSLFSGSWSFLDLAFSGTAQSVVFRGLPVYLTGFDDVTLLDTPHPVPEPAVLGLFGFGVLLIGVAAGMRRRRAYHA